MWLLLLLLHQHHTYVRMLPTTAGTTTTITTTHTHTTTPMSRTTYMSCISPPPTPLFRPHPQKQRGAPKFPFQKLPCGGLLREGHVKKKKKNGYSNGRRWKRVIVLATIIIIAFLFLILFFRCPDTCDSHTHTHTHTTHTPPPNYQASTKPGMTDLTTCMPACLRHCRLLSLSIAHARNTHAP